MTWSKLTTTKQITLDVPIELSFFGELDDDQIPCSIDDFLSLWKEKNEYDEATMHEMLLAEFLATLDAAFFANQIFHEHIDQDESPEGKKMLGRLKTESAFVINTLKHATNLSYGGLHNTKLGNYYHDEYESTNFGFLPERQGKEGSI